MMFLLRYRFPAPYLYLPTVYFLCRVVAMRQCVLCDKSYKKTTVRKLLRGHYNPVHVKRQRANLQLARLPNAAGRVLLCTKCLKTRGKAGK